MTALTADRLDDAAFAESLAGLAFDGAIDCSGRSVLGAHIAAKHLSGTPSYAYVSSLNAYRHWPPGPVSGEGDPLWETNDDNVDDYGPMKAESERVLGAAFGGRLLAVRAGLIVGPNDDTARMTSWLRRIADEPETIVPDSLAQPMSFVDARDLAEWVVAAVERRLHGPVNATGRTAMTTMGDLLETCRAVIRASGGTPAALVPVSEERLLAAGIEPWRHLPFWLPREVATTAWQVNTDRARDLGLRTRQLADTLSDTWDWMRQTDLRFPPPEHSGPGIPADVRARLIR